MRLLSAGIGATRPGVHEVAPATPGASRKRKHFEHNKSALSFTAHSVVIVASASLCPQHKNILPCS